MVLPSEGGEEERERGGGGGGEEERGGKRGIHKVWERGRFVGAE